MTRPTVRERLREKICPNCGEPVVRGQNQRKGPAPKYCSNYCKRQMNNRLMAEGAAVIGLIKAWRIDRGTGEIAKRSFQQVCEIVDLLNAQDKEASRPRADYYAATLLADGTRYFDRQRPNNGKKKGESDASI